MKKILILIGCLLVTTSLTNGSQKPKECTDGISSGYHDGNQHKFDTQDDWVAFLNEYGFIITYEDQHLPHKESVSNAGFILTRANNMSGKGWCLYTFNRPDDKQNHELHVVCNNDDEPITTTTTTEATTTTTTELTVTEPEYTTPKPTTVTETITEPVTEPVTTTEVTITSNPITTTINDIVETVITTSVMPNTSDGGNTLMFMVGILFILYGFGLKLKIK